MGTQLPQEPPLPPPGRPFHQLPRILLYRPGRTFPGPGDAEAARRGAHQGGRLERRPREPGATEGAGGGQRGPFVQCSLSHPQAWGRGQGPGASGARLAGLSGRRPRRSASPATRGHSSRARRLSRWNASRWTPRGPAAAGTPPPPPGALPLGTWSPWQPRTGAEGVGAWGRGAGRRPRAVPAGFGPRRLGLRELPFPPLETPVPAPPTPRSSDPSADLGGP